MLYATISETLEFVSGVVLGLFVGIGHTFIKRKIKDSKICEIGTPKNHICTVESFQSIPWDNPGGKKLDNNSDIMKIMFILFLSLFLLFA